MPDAEAKSRSWSFGYSSEYGGRTTQEDRWELCEFRTADGLDALLALVADGIGGRSTGELASQWAKETVRDYVLGKPPATSEIPQALVAAFQAANIRIHDEALDNPTRAGMGTTCTVVVIVGRRLYLAHVGDSRAYLARGNTIQQLSIDHTWAQEALQAGRSPEEIRNHPNRGVIKRYLGITEDVNVDTRYQPPGGGDPKAYPDSAGQPLFLQDGDSILLCSDGVSDVLRDEQLLAVVRRHPAAENKAATAVVQAALKAGASDNVTAIVVDLPGAVKVGSGLPRWAIWGLAALMLLVIGVTAALFFRRPGAEATPTPTIVVASPATPAPVVKVEVSPLPSATATRRPAATHTASPTPAPVATEGGPASTPVPTFTTAPTATPTPTSTQKPTSPTTPVLPIDRPVLKKPPDRDTRSGYVQFEWGGVLLPSGTAYQIVWWRQDESAGSARELGEATSSTSQTIDLGQFYATQLVRPSRIYWTVIVVQTPSRKWLMQPTQDNSRLLHICRIECEHRTTVVTDPNMTFAQS
jgi:protein phosphatase